MAHNFEYYITSMRTPAWEQISLDDILSHRFDNVNFRNPKMTGYTITSIANKPFNRETMKYATHLGSVLNNFVRIHEDLYPVKEEHYRTFFIPKKTGGYRTIREPMPALKAAQYDLKRIFENEFHALHHTCAYAYVKGRSTLDAMKKHQGANSNWYLKIDYHDFFGSITKEFTMKMLRMIFPFNIVIALGYEDVLKKAIELCFLNNGLPQGTPISPMLTNLIMIPIDHMIAKYFYGRFVYTRYADDICISAKESFDWRYVVRQIEDAGRIFEAPFHINEKKTRYGSKAGSNWNLGLMTNKDNKITVGHENKKVFKARLNSYICAKLNHLPTDRDEILQLNGIISYYKMVEKEYIEYVIDKFNEKYHVDLMKMILDDIKI